MDEKIFYKSMLDNMYEGIYFVDIDRRIVFWNKGAERITGYTASEVTGHFCYDNILNHVDQNGCELCWNGCPLKQTNSDGLTRNASVFLHHKQGYRIPVSVRAAAVYEEGTIIGSVEVFRDESEHNEIMRNLDEFKLLALTDPLTGLPNRRYIDSFLDSKMNEFFSLNIPFGLAFMDIDRFKDFNDTYGHDIGDLVLQTIAKTFSGITRNSDLIGRWGGEEFIAVLTGIREENLFGLSETIRTLVEKSSIQKDGKPLSVTLSIGATLFKKDDTIESAMKRADDLLFISKSEGRNRVTTG